MIKNYNPKIHQIRFSALFENQILKNAFKKHLINENCSEGLEFYYDVQKFIEINNVENQKKEFKKIYLKYFTKKNEEPFSEQNIHEKISELNIPWNMREKMKKKYERIDFQSNLEKEQALLEKISKLVIDEIKSDSVNKFIISVSKIFKNKNI